MLNADLAGEEVRMSAPGAERTFTECGLGARVLTPMHVQEARVGKGKGSADLGVLCFGNYDEVTDASRRRGARGEP